MANHRDADWLLGRRFVTDFTVLAIGGAGADAPVRLRLHEPACRAGEDYVISRGELQAAIEAGFVVEADAP